MSQRTARRRAGTKEFGGGIRPIVKRVLCVLILLCAVIVSIRTTWIVSGTLFDSDTSSELILGEKLAREGGILSETWAYSTELQVIDCQIVYALLFRVCGDWFLVRFWGAVLMQAMMLGAFGFMARQARIPLNRFCLAGAAMLLPFSVAWGRIVLYHNYYAFHMIMANLTVGCYLGALRRTRQENAWKRWPLWVFAGCLALVSFLAGLEGVRQMMVCTVPLLAAAVLTAMGSERGNPPERRSLLRQAWPGLALGAASFACSGMGYLVNLSAFAGKYSYTDYSGQYVTLRGSDQLETIVRSFLSTLGFHDQTNLFTLHGILGITGLLIWVAALLLAFHTLRHSEDDEARFLSIFMLMTHTVMVFVFMLLALEDYQVDLYFLPVTFWILPMLAKADLRPDSGVPEAKGRPGFPGLLLAGDAKLSVHGLIGTLVLIMFLVNGMYYTLFFRDPKTYGKEITYDGLRYTDTDNVAAMRPVAEYLREQGYTLLYASYWDAAVITELTDGQVKSVPVEVGRRKHPIKYYDWLSDLKLRDPERAAGGKAAVLADFELAASLEEGNQYGAVENTEVSLGGYRLFDLPDSATLAKDLWKD